MRVKEALVPVVVKSGDPSEAEEEAGAGLLDLEDGAGDGGIGAAEVVGDGAAVVGEGAVIAAIEDDEAAGSGGDDAEGVVELDGEG